MCETFFGLKRRPFLLAPDTEAFFSSESMEETQQEIERTIRNGEGIALIFGTAGTGKTLLTQILQQALKTNYTVVLVSHSRLDTPKALFLQLLHDLHISYSSGETVELRLQLLDFAQKASTQGVVLLFDDAQHLSPSVLEEIRLLTDSAPLSGRTGFRAVLAGAMDFEETLTLPNLEAFNQRVASRCYLDSFSGEETSKYIHRQTDGLRIDPPHNMVNPLFTEDAKRRIYQLTDGVPRLVNQLCGQALQIAAEREAKSVDGSLVNNAWTSLQHIASDNATEEIECSAVQESSISPEQIEEIVEQKRNTFKLRQFDSIEFGTLTDSETVETEMQDKSCSFHENGYKPAYPEDDDTEDDENAEWANEEPEVYRLPCVPVLATRVPAKSLGIPAKLFEIPPCDLILGNFNRQHRKFRRQDLLKKIQHRLGLFVSVLRNMESSQLEQSVTINESEESNMNVETLQEYGASILDGRPPFVRKEPQYAYQTTKSASQEDVEYPDPKTGVPVMLRWCPENLEKTERFGVSYTEFLNRENTVIPAKAGSQTSELVDTSIVRTSLNASQDSFAEWSRSGVDETFEESQQISDSAISLAELFRVNSSALQRIEESAEFKGLDAVVQRQLEAIIHRITKAAEKIEHAAEVSERAGRHVSSAAEFVEAEVKSALPVYADLFQQWSEFQNLITSELESARQRHPEPPQLRTFPRRQVMIERAVPTIDVESLLR